MKSLIDRPPVRGVYMDTKGYGRASGIRPLFPCRDPVPDPGSCARDPPEGDRRPTDRLAVYQTRGHHLAVTQLIFTLDSLPGCLSVCLPARHQPASPAREDNKHGRQELRGVLGSVPFKLKSTEM